MSTYIKDPDAKLDYINEWGGWLGDDDTIIDSMWIAPDGITVDSSTFDDTTASVWLSGGTVGTTYTVTNRITTAAARSDDRSIKIKIKER